MKSNSMKQEKMLSDILESSKLPTGRGSCCDDDDCIDGKLNVAGIDEQIVANSLYTVSLPDPDLLIRTSNEKRISNFLLWQLSYAEFYIIDILWPDFTPTDVDKAIIEFAKRARRMGDIKPSLI